jgi:hypothetical protein
MHGGQREVIQARLQGVELFQDGRYTCLIQWLLGVLGEIDLVVTQEVINAQKD